MDGDYSMNTSLKYITTIVAVLVVGASLYYVLVVKGGVLHAELPDSNTIDISQESLVSSNPDSVGEVLGETQSSNTANPLKDLYVNPFSN